MWTRVVQHCGLNREWQIVGCCFDCYPLAGGQVTKRFLGFLALVCRIDQTTDNCIRIAFILYGGKQVGAKDCGANLRGVNKGSCRRLTDRR